MQQRQLRLGDILDDYCPRERRVTNHAVVAMIGADVKQTRCTTCDAEHEYKHAKVPRQRRKAESPAALYAQVVAKAPKRVTHESPPDNESHESQGGRELHESSEESVIVPEEPTRATTEMPGAEVLASENGDAATTGAEESDAGREEEEGPVHRPLIRASLPRPEGHPPHARPIPEFTIRQPGGRANRFRPRHQRGGPQFQGNRSNGNFGGMRGGRPPQGGMPSRLARRHGPGGRKRSK